MSQWNSLQPPPEPMLYQHFRTEPARMREAPVFVIGLVGFGPEQEKPILATLRGTHLGGVRWRVGSFGEADAWLVNGACTEALPDGSLRVAGSGSTSPPVRFELGAVDRPIAFSEPLAAPEFDPACRFRLESVDSIHAVLARFVQWLRPLAAQIALASQLIEVADEFAPAGVYHVTSHGRLLAVVELQREAGLSPTAAPADFRAAAWHARPSSAGFIPEDFQRVSLSLLMWQYATRTSRDLLPERYRQRVIHYRRPPRLEHRLLKDSHLWLLRELAFGACTFDQLRQRLGSSDESLAHDLAALYLVGSITVNPARARVRPQAAMQSRNHAGSMASDLSDWPSRSGAATLPPQVADGTAPGLFQGRAGAHQAST
jgi:hypothetical protein